MNKVTTFLKKYLGKERIEIKAWLLIIIVILNVLPVIQANLFSKTIGNSSSELTVGITFVFELLLIAFYFIKYKIKFNKTTLKYMIVFSALIVILLITQIVIYFKGIFNARDIIDIGAKFCTITLLIIAFTSARIEKEELKKFFKFMVILGMIACLYNFIYYFSEIVGLLDIKNSYSVHIKSFFGNRNQFGLFLMMVTMSNFYLLVNEKNKNNIIIYIITIIILLCNMLFTMSRTALGATAFFLIISLVSILKGKRRFIAILSIIGVAIVIGISIFIIDPSLSQKIENLFIRPETITTGGGRTKIWQEGITIVLRENLISGVGRFAGVDQLNNYLLTLGLHTSQFHSVYVETFVSGGILALIALIFMFGRNIYYLAKSRLPLEEKNVIICMIVTFMIIGIVESCRFSMGYVDTIFTLMFFSIPILQIEQAKYLNFKEEEVENEQSTKENEG